ncbi:unnamed protein product [Onchocerca flexuosa]|uniref:Helicase_RecD domain-containing protein n=1 Tax=Onchocerca flexuosa TaxID=387005 RepID=A0A183HVI7_9BILA|nr:unnamed protein product [Onchocerca flexuosa]
MHLTSLDVITEKTLQATCCITAARGRGKSAALGLAIAGAIGFDYANFVMRNYANFVELCPLLTLNEFH